MQQEVNLAFKVIFGLILVILSVYIAYFKPIGFDVDSYAYYLATINLEAVNSFEGNQEPIFKLIRYFSFIISNDVFRGLTVLYMFICISLKTVLIGKYSSNFYISIAAYVSIYFLLHDLIQIRVALAAVFFIWAIPDIKSQSKVYFIKIAIATLCHYSSVFLIPLYFLNAASLSTFRIILGYIVSFSTLTLSPLLISIATEVSNYLPGTIGYKAKRYLVLMKESVHVDFNLFSMSFLIFMSLSVILVSPLVDAKKLSKDEIIYIKILAISNYVYISFSFIPVLSARISELLGVSVVLALPILWRCGKFKIFGSIYIAVFITLFFYINFFLKDFIDRDLLSEFYLL